jgi:hypothetical protein
MAAHNCRPIASSFGGKNSNDTATLVAIVASNRESISTLSMQLTKLCHNLIIFME